MTKREKMAANFALVYPPASTERWACYQHYLAGIDAVLGMLAEMPQAHHSADAWRQILESELNAEAK